MDKRIIFIGGGGHARVLIDLVRVSGQFEVVGILDTQLARGASVSDVPVLGNDEFLPELFSKGITKACIAVGSVKENSARKSLYKKVMDAGFHLPSLIHPRAIVAESNINISPAVQIMGGAVINANTSIGENTIINTGAIVEHDCVVGAHVHVCPGAVISGGCVLGNGAFIGAVTTVIQGIRIGKNAVIAAGSVVLNDVPEGITVKGVPAR